jgi:adenine-specific DNA-methyltransferase
MAALLWSFYSSKYTLRCQGARDRFKHKKSGKRNINEDVIIRQMLDVGQTVASPEMLRLRLSSRLTRKQRSGLGQFMTPVVMAEFMASLFEIRPSERLSLLDAGAGFGALTDAFLRRIDSERVVERVDVTAFEIDPDLRASLRTLLEGAPSSVRHEIHDSDFIEYAPAWITDRSRRFSHAILNPPYKKIRNESMHRAALRSVGIETVNLYSAFVALCVELLEPCGQLVAILPRSFCNGTYYKSFRRMLLDLCAIRRIHLFGARDKAFSDDGVLQENVIVVLERGGSQGPVLLSTSTDDYLTDMEQNVIAFDDIVQPDDRERFIRIPTSGGGQRLGSAGFEIRLLGDIGIEVSTGPVVDFRMREHLRAEPSGDTVPLLYPGHFQRGQTIWPRPEFRKPNALALNDETWRWLYPKGFYTVVRRLTSKEERRRVVANVVDPGSFPNVELLGFENHLNVFHQRKRGLDCELAHGLAAYLNTAEVDDHFRSFNGHTQVNATDLRAMRYPPVDELRKLGREAMQSLEDKSLTA